MTDNAPILIGTGQAVQAIPENLQDAASHTDMAGMAAKAALADAGLGGAAIDHISCVRIFSDSSPAYHCPFGRAERFPLAVAKRIGARPKSALYDAIGGQSPQTLVAEAAASLLRGDAEVVMIAGGEALANMRAAQRAGAPLEWAETDDLSCDYQDRGQFHGAPIIEGTEINHGLLEPMMYYGLMETARRISRGQSVDELRAEMGASFASFSEVASRNPYAMFREVFTAAELAVVSSDNRPLISPYSKRLVAKDGVNQGAAVILTTTGKARELGIDPAKWVYLHGHAQTKERLMLAREDLGRSNAMDAAFAGALSQAGITGAQAKHLDIYSCFPIVVSLAKAALGIADGDGRALTQTGGLPFFGGPGNNYTLHGIAELMTTLRADPRALGLAYGNGGWMSKHAVGIYGRAAPSVPYADRPLGWTDPAPVPAQVDIANGAAKIESYIVLRRRGEAIGAVIIGALDEGWARFYAKLGTPKAEDLTALQAGKKTDAPIYVTGDKKGNTFRFQ